jgi:hypothetical protein
LVIVGCDNDCNDLSWNTGDNKPGATYEIFAQFDGAGEWVMIGSTQKRKFLHTGVQTGRYMVYAVRARRGDTVSELCAPVSIYAANTTPVLTMSKAA